MIAIPMLNLDYQVKKRHSEGWAINNLVNRNQVLILVISIALSSATPTLAYEIDPFWHRSPPPPDSIKPINEEVNRRLQAAVDKTGSCNLEEFYRNIHNQLNAESQFGGAIAGMEIWALEESESRYQRKIESIAPPDLEQSIYGGAQGLDSLVFWLDIYEKAIK